MVDTRRQILNVLERVLLKGGYASLLMRKSLENIAERDRAFAAEVIYGTIRNKILLEAQWKPFIKKIKPRTGLLLDMTVYQLFFTSVKDYACVNEAVELAGKGEKGFVNAVLRRVIEAGLTMPEGDDIGGASLRTSHPEWLLKMWQAQYGKETARRIAEADQGRSTVFGRINTLKINKEDLLKDDKVHFLNELSFTYDGLLTDTDLFCQGKVLIQDIHSAMVPLYLEVKPGMKVLDACAAPGTKTQEIAMLMNNEGKITAGELHANRLSLISRLMETTGVKIVEPKCLDASEASSYAGMTFDRILLDVPCSGLGDLRGKPEIRYRLKPQDIDEVVGLQRKILGSCSGLLKKGGILVYSTCTLNRKENEGQIDAFLKDHADFVMLKRRTLFPYEDGGDGFFICQLGKN